MFSPFLFALALLAQDAEAAPAAAAPAAPAAEAAEAPYPPGAPRDAYGLVAWCYGALSGHRDLRDRAMPEVVRIESTFRRPGTSLEEDLAVYDELDALSERNLGLFRRAMEAAERASPQPLNVQGADAVRRGRATWSQAGELSDARLAQEWMSWTLPARCEATAVALERRARLAQPAFDFDRTAPAQDAPAEVPPESTETPGEL